MKIMCLLGSPRPKGNTVAIAERFISTAQSLGAETEMVSLNKLSYRGCQACLTCKTKLDKCVLKDDLEKVLDSVRQADVLVIASPIYYGELTSQMKAFIDRTYSFLLPDYLTNPNPSRLSPGKQLVFILTQGQPDEKMFADVFPRYDFFFKWYGYQQSHLIRGCGLNDKDAASKREDLMQLAEKTAQQIMR
ncbi:MAG: flavodoxin family protein [Desulfobacterales bacterium]|nr:flavodoxin family protein [Desulfobacterales bacterium]